MSQQTKNEYRRCPEDKAEVRANFVNEVQSKIITKPYTMYTKAILKYKTRKELVFLACFHSLKIYITDYQNIAEQNLSNNLMVWHIAKHFSGQTTRRQITVIVMLGGAISILREVTKS